MKDKPDGVDLEQGFAVIVETPGAGGYGPPAARSKDDLARDRKSGKFSADYLARHYPADEAD